MGCHLAWIQTPRNEGGIGDINYPLVSDLKREICQAYNVLNDDGEADRGLFLINPEGGQGRHSPRSAEVDLRWQAAGGWQDSLRLQHPEGVYPSPRSQAQGRYADLRQDPHWEDHHPRGRAL